MMTCCIASKWHILALHVCGLKPAHAILCPACRSDLLEALAMLDAEEDINAVLRYFSYEHFYVIYCKFWELDAEHDFLISKDDMLKYGNHSLTFRILDRIFAQVGGGGC